MKIGSFSPARRGKVGPACAVGILALVALCSASLAQESPDPAKGLKSKVVAERLAAVEALRISSDAQNEKLLLGALNDRDWEVVEKAAAALADRGGDSAVFQLVKLCTEGPIVRTRRTAARTLAKISPDKAMAELVKLAAGKHSVHALQAMSFLSPTTEDSSTTTAIQRGLKSKDAAVRHAAQSAIAALPNDAANEALVAILQGDDAEAAAIALDAVAASGEAHFLQPLFQALQQPRVADVIERRLLAAAAACMITLDKLGRPQQTEKTLQSIAAPGPTSEAEVEARVLRLYAALDGVAIKDSALSNALLPLMTAGLTSAKAPVRKAAIAAVARRVPLTSKETLLALAAKDPDAGVRLLAIRELTRALGPADSELFFVLTEKIANDAAPLVREEAAVALGKPELPNAAAALTRGLIDPNWAVATCAAISLGKTHDLAALEPLTAMQTHADWRYRASAAVGLCALMKKEAVPALIAALGDSDASVKRTAFVFLEQQFKAGLSEERSGWESWWKANGAGARVIDPEQARKKRESYGYAESTTAVFENLDVVVLESRGDHIQRLLTDLKIAHRMTQASKLEEAALHPGAIYVSNCTGEIEPRDVERIAWYVRAGGVLFGSCWSLHETIEKVHPGVLRQLPTKSEVLDDVVACAVDRSNPFLKNVFGQDTEPLYHLEGSHLIEVLEPELCQVLIDSPQALERWGGGNLAATFRSGHGLILDSANHFELQGLEVAPGLKTSEDRIAFAFDRMGMDFETWRKTQNEKWWDSALKASQNVFDWSALSFVTNFVRAKRVVDG